MNERSYWNSNGEAQALYDEMQAAAFKYTKVTGALFHSYHRYGNEIQHDEIQVSSAG